MPHVLSSSRCVTSNLSSSVYSVSAGVCVHAFSHISFPINFFLALLPLVFRARRCLSTSFFILCRSSTHSSHRHHLHHHHPSRDTD
jgi:hypothetical protein